MFRGSSLNLKFKVKDLIIKLETNRSNHKENYDLALLQYKEELEGELKKMLTDVQEGRDIPHAVPLEKPEEYLKEYDTALDIFKMTSQTEVEIDQKTFTQLVRDEWDWKMDFESKTMGYARARR